MGKKHSKPDYYEIPEDNHKRAHQLDILYLEDNIINCKVFKGMVENLGLSLLYVRHTEDFFDRLAEGYPKVIVLDMQIDRGKEVGKRIAESLRSVGIGIPIVLLSAHIVEQDWLRQHKIIYLMKPYTRKELEIFRGLCQK